jgi:FKBP-type peptidyl-prolyl cis-trans isomerase FkpA/FKBP-type peptidyl-prolyl cis-trans isomerase FklB
MRKITSFLAIALLVVGVSYSYAQDSASKDKPLTLKTKKQKASYALGYNMGRQIKDMAKELDMKMILQGFKDSALGNKEQIPFPEMQKNLQEFYSGYSKRLQEKKRIQGEKNKIEGDAFLKKNAKNKGVKVTKSGLQYMVIKEGKGPKPKASDQVKVHYRGTHINGKVFDSSYKRGQPNTFPLQRMIRGWVEGLQLMSVGSKYKFFIPAKLAYGERGQRDIAPHAVLIFEVELLGIEPPAAKKPPKPAAPTKQKTPTKEKKK